MYIPHQFGREAEDQALAWYLNQGNYHLIARNYRCRGGEIDLIFEQRGLPIELVFVEVRARAEGAKVDALHSVDWKKQARLRHTISHFLSRYRGPARMARLDLISKDGTTWNHIPNIW